ncbi:hypothetical protein GCM10010214_61940 [Streptomyces abikoensis]|nr:hypothetical protein GCM10010214_61940 [Streptomyces abikoensis]
MFDQLGGGTDPGLPTPSQGGGDAVPDAAGGLGEPGDDRRAVQAAAPDRMISRRPDEDTSAAPAAPAAPPCGPVTVRASTAISARHNDDRPAPQGSPLLYGGADAPDCSVTAATLAGVLTM